MTTRIDWTFPYGVNLTPTGSNHAAIETFRDNVIESLTREVLQNSLDAHNDKKEEPVHVTFDRIELTPQQIPNVKMITDYALPRATKFWEELGNRDTLKYLAKFDKTIHADTLNVLKISDYNTRGLLPENFQSLVRADAYSEKRTDTASGSKGIGKAAPFAASDLRMVFYSSFATDQQSRAAGILNYVSFTPREIENEVTQSRASYLGRDNHAIDTQMTFGHPTRTANEYGTDLFIMGFKQFEEWAKNIKLSTLENFLVAIFNGNLSVRIDTEEINQTNLGDVVHSLSKEKGTKREKNRIQAIVNYYDVLSSEDTKKVEFDERFEKYAFIKKPNDGFLLIKQHEPANRKVLQTRQAGMKIYERTHISGTINFTGIFQAVGTDLNSYLRDIENPNHNDWSVDRIDQDDKKERKVAEEFLKDLHQWYKSTVKESFEAKVKEKVGAFGVADLLPILSEKDQAETQADPEEDSGITFKIGSFDVKEKRSKPLPAGTVEEEDAQLDKLAEELDPKGQEKEFNDGVGGGKGGASNEPGDGKASGGASTEGDLGQEGDKVSRPVSYRKIAHEKSLAVKIIEDDFTKGLYRLVGRHTGKQTKLAITFHYVDARGVKEEATLLDVDATQNAVSLADNKLCIDNFTTHSSLNIQFKVEKNIRLKMRIDVYEVRS